MTDPKTTAEPWQDCRRGSCHRHASCQYHPCHSYIGQERSERVIREQRDEWPDRQAGDQNTTERLRGLERLVAWLAYHVVMHWPLSVERRGVGIVYWALLPWAGLWVHHPDGARL